MSIILLLGEMGIVWTGHATLANLLNMKQLNGFCPPVNRDRNCRNGSTTVCDGLPGVVLEVGVLNELDTGMLGALLRTLCSVSIANVCRLLSNILILPAAGARMLPITTR